MPQMQIVITPDASDDDPNPKPTTLDVECSATGPDGVLVLAVTADNQLCYERDFNVGGHDDRNELERVLGPSVLYAATEALRITEIRPGRRVNISPPR